MLKIHRHQALLCSAFLALCVVVSWPVAETGMHDDWSYVRTVQLLAQTGHVVFNGWGAPLLGIQLLPAALLVKLFGFSFTMIRLTTILIGLLTAALVQRTAVRCGLREWNASIATITLMLSPVFLPTVTGFLSDVWSIFAIVVCLYCCLRALSATSENAAIGWIFSAAVGNAVLGTSRQIAWLGLLIIVPCTLWLLRRKRKVLVAGAIAFASGFVIVGTAMAWFAQHAYTLPEQFNLKGMRFSLHHPSILIRPALEMPMLLLPILLMFLPAIFRSNRKSLYVASVAAAVFCICAGYEHYIHLLHNWYVPFIKERGAIFGPKGVYMIWPVWGRRPPLMPIWLRAGLSLITVVGFVSWIAFTLGRDSRKSPEIEDATISWHDLVVLLVPFAACYLIFLMSRAFKDLFIDRYIETLVLVAIILITRQYQDHVRLKLPKTSLVLALIVAAYSVGTLHDAFAMYRAVVTAANEVIASGVPRSRFDGGWEYDGMTQVLEDGYVHQRGIRMPGTTLMFGHRRSGPCESDIDVWTPNVQPDYTLSFTPDGCGGATSYAPVTYRRWLTPHTLTLYVVKAPDFSGKSGLFPSYGDRRPVQDSNND